MNVTYTGIPTELYEELIAYLPIENSFRKQLLQSGRRLPMPPETLEKVQKQQVARLHAFSHASTAAQAAGKVMKQLLIEKGIVNQIMDAAVKGKTSVEIIELTQEENMYLSGQGYSVVWVSGSDDKKVHKISWGY